VRETRKAAREWIVVTSLNFFPSLGLEHVFKACNKSIKVNGIQIIIHKLISISLNWDNSLPKNCNTQLHKALKIKMGVDLCFIPPTLESAIVWKFAPTHLGKHMQLS
jgi:hypothetical protein